MRQRSLREGVKDMTTAAEQHLSVRVSGWSCGRHVIVCDDTVSIEIARTHCSHCPTCRGRVVHCERALGSRQYSRQSVGGGEYFILPLPAGLAGDLDKVVAFLAGALNLEIWLVAG